MRQILIFISILGGILLSSMQVHAQVPSDLDELNQLRNGVLLVKLYTRNIGIEALKNNGLEKKAEIMRKEQQFKNLLISSAFENAYSFTPKVYFFFSDDAKKILQGDFEGVLMGYDLRPLANVDLSGKPYFIAEFGFTEGKGINALLIRNKKFEQLDPPFPYFVRTYEGVPLFERSSSKVVELWNDRLFKRYGKYFDIGEGNHTK